MWEGFSVGGGSTLGFALMRSVSRGIDAPVFLYLQVDDDVETTSCFGVVVQECDRSKLTKVTCRKH